MKMVHAEVSIPPRAALEGGDRRRLRGYAEILYRLRRPLVAALLVSGDFVAAIAAIALSGMLMKWSGLALLERRDIAVPFLILAFFAVGLYAGAGPSPYERFRLRALCIIGFVVIDLVAALAVGKPAALIVASSCLAVCLLIFGHYIEAAIRILLIRADLWGASTIVVGCRDHHRKLSHLLTLQPDLGLMPIGFFDTSDDTDLEKVPLPLPLIGTPRSPAGVRSRVEVAIFCSADDLVTFASDFQARMPSCRLLLVEDTYNIPSLWLHTRTLGGAVGIEIRRGLFPHYNWLLKRAIDILFAIPIALFIWPVIAVLALAIKLVDPGPAFYVQERVGHNGTTLRTFKLRTMFVDAERRLEEHLSRSPRSRAQWERCFKLDDDPRVLPIIGNFLRRASLDELPQLWNVIRGDMSLVGPRPFPSYHMKCFDPEFQAIRTSVPPGITGMWQISSRSDGDLQAQKTQDLFYIRNRSILLDIYILLQTVPAVLSAHGAR